MEPKQLEQLLAKVGGKYKLVTLFQKRMRELQRGLPKLVGNTEAGNLWDVVSTEIMDTKVDLIMGDEAEQMRKEMALREGEDSAEGAAKSEKAEKGEKGRGSKSE